MRGGTADGLAAYDERVRRVTRVLAFGFWLWCAFIAFGAGFLGTLLNCEGGNGCKAGSPSWLQPWTWGEHYVYPEAWIIAVIALIPASAFVAFVVAHRQWPGVLALVLSTLLISYAYFGGLTSDGRSVFWFGPLLGLAALGIMSASPGRERFAHRNAKLS